MKKYVLVGSFFLFFLLLAGAGCADNSMTGDSASADDSRTAMQSDDSAREDDSSDSAMKKDDSQSDTSTSMMEEQAKVFNITGKNFAFSRTEIKVKKGDKVTVNFSSTDGYHDWVLDEFNAATDKVQTGGSTSVTFTADQTGTFEFYCSVGSHRQLGMVGKLIVE